MRLDLQRLGSQCRHSERFQFSLIEASFDSLEQSLENTDVFNWRLEYLKLIYIMSNQTSLLLCMFLGCGWKLQYPERTHRENMQSPKNQPGMESFAPVIFIFPFTNLSIVTSLKGKQVLWHKGHQLYVSEGQNFSGQTLWGWTLKYNNIIEITLFDIYFGI